MEGKIGIGNVSIALRVLDVEHDAFDVEAGLDAHAGSLDHHRSLAGAGVLALGNHGVSGIFNRGGQVLNLSLIHI